MQSVRWLRSSTPIDPNLPPTPSRLRILITGGKTQAIIPPWEHHADDMHEIKLDEPKYAIGSSPPERSYVNAHPFWQERVQRQAAAEDDMAYMAQRYGLDFGTNKPKSQGNKSQRKSHTKRPSIRGLEISRPVPIPSTIRRANTVATATAEFPRRNKHQNTASLDTSDRPLRRPQPAFLRVQIPSTASALDVPEDVSVAAPTTSVVYPIPATRSLGLASRTLVGTSRPKASATRAYVNTSKPLPSPPPYDGSDLSLPSSGPSHGSHKFVMAKAHRVKISASKPLMVPTPIAAETPIDFEEEKSLS